MQCEISAIIKVVCICYITSVFGFSDKADLGKMRKSEQLCFREFYELIEESQNRNLERIYERLKRVLQREGEESINNYCNEDAFQVF